MDDFYQEHILDHYKKPRNVGSINMTLKGSLVHRHAANAGCGDVVDADLLIQDGVVVDLKWRGTGCAISQAAMSLASEWIIGKTLHDLHALTREKLLELLGLSTITPAREKCLLLPTQLVRQFVVPDGMQLLKI